MLVTFLSRNRKVRRTTSFPRRVRWSSACPPWKAMMPTQPRMKKSRLPCPLLPRHCPRGGGPFYRQKCRVIFKKVKTTPNEILYGAAEGERDADLKIYHQFSSYSSHALVELRKQSWLLVGVGKLLFYKCSKRLCWCARELIGIGGIVFGNYSGEICILFCFLLVLHYHAHHIQMIILYNNTHGVKTVLVSA